MWDLTKHDIPKSYGLMMPKRGVRVGWVTRTGQCGFDSGADPDQPCQWDTKRKLFSLVEVYALLSDVLVNPIITEKCYFKIPRNHIYHVRVRWFTTLTVIIAESLPHRPNYCELRVLHDRFRLQFLPLVHTRRSLSTLFIMILTIVVIWEFLIRILFVKFTCCWVWSELCGHYPLHAETIILPTTSHDDMTMMVFWSF